MPSNPQCWEIMTVEREDGSATLRRAMLALAPSLLPADRCLSRSLDIAISAPLVPVAGASSEQLHGYGQISRPIDRLRAAAKTNCEAAAALRFIRAPWLATVESELVLGDLRYDRESALGFAEIAIDGEPSCPAFVPRWREPREALIHGLP